MFFPLCGWCTHPHFQGLSMQTSQKHSHLNFKIFLEEHAPRSPKTLCTIHAQTAPCYAQTSTLYLCSPFFNLAFRGTQATVLEIFLRYLVETHKCTNASKLISWQRSQQEVGMARIVTCNCNSRTELVGNWSSFYLNDYGLPVEISKSCDKHTTRIALNIQ